MSEAAAATVSACRKTEPAKLSRQIRGDLDWIVMKALEKDPARRYQTANDLARDIQRYLSGESVEARPPRLLDRTRRWVRMRRPIVWSAVASAMAGAILLGVVFVISANRGAVRLEFSDAAAARQCTISIDGDDIRVENLGEPIKLRPGKHQLRVLRGDLEIETREFDVLRHGVHVVHVQIAASPATAISKPASAEEAVDFDEAERIRKRAFDLGCRGEYGRATSEYTKAIRRYPDEVQWWLQRAVAELADGQNDLYRRHCAEMLRRFGQRRNLGHHPMRRYLLGMLHGARRHCRSYRRPGLSG